MPSMNRLADEPDCNVVDVRGDDGLYKRGKIVDCAHGGLMINWDCSGDPTPQFEPFERIYRHVFYLQTFTDGQAIAQGRTSVEVLLHRSDKVPRTWYPGTLLAVFSDRRYFGLVQAATPDGPVTVVARAHRMRKPHTKSELEQLRVQQDQFVKHRLVLPKGYNRGTASTQEIVHVLNETTGGPICRTRTLIRAVSMDDKTLDFIAVGNEYMPKSWRVPVKTAGGKLRLLLEEAGKTYESRQKQLKRKFCEVDQELSEEEGMHSDINLPFAATAGLRLLHRDVLSCVFEYLDSAEQSRLRRVCAYWDWMLTLPRVTQALRVSYSNRIPGYLSVASLHYAWTPHTKTIINACFNCTSDLVIDPYSAPPLYCNGSLFRILMQNGLHAPVELLVLSDLFWLLGMYNNYLYRLQKFVFAEAVGHFVAELNGLARACQTLVLRKVKAILGCGPARDFGSIKHVSVHILTGRIVGCLTVKEFWSRMDASLPPLDHAQHQQVLTGIQSPGSKVPHVLNDVQSRDPRDDANYRNRVWTAENLDSLELDKLSKITLYSLANLHLNGWKPTMEFVLSW